MFGIGKLADHTVLERIKQGDEKMLVHLYKEHHTMVKNFILKNTNIPAKTELSAYKNKIPFKAESACSTLG